MADSILSTNYNVQENWLTKIAPNYFEVEDVSILKTSLLGYINEIMANIVEDTGYNISILYQEIFPNRAVLPNSLYSYSALAKFEDFNAVPAIVKFALAIRTKDIIAQAASIGTDIKEFRIDKFSTFSIDNDFKYFLPHDVVISLNRSLISGIYKWILSPRYDTTIANPYFDVTSPYIHNTLFTFEDEEYILLPLYGLQLSKQTTKFNVYSQDLVENTMFNCEYTGELAYFDVFYIAPDETERTFVKKYFVDSYVEDSDEIFCYYEFSGTNKIEVSFSALSKYFRPEYNSQIVIDIYTTRGKEANFEYTGNTSGFKFNADLDYGNTTIDPTNIRHFCEIASPSSGGKDAMELKELRDKISNEFSNRKNIITENDLQTYFDSLSYSSTVKFFKKRDDVIKRIYNAFVLLKSDDLGVIPTNTTEMILFEDDYTKIQNDDAFTIPAGSRIELYDETLNYFRINKSSLSELELMNRDSNPDIYTYGNLYLMKIRSNPTSISYYLNSLFKDYNLKCMYINNKISSEFILSKISVSRNAVLTNEYTIETSMYLSTSPDNFFNVAPDGKVLTNTNKLLLRGFIEENDIVIGYFDFTPDMADFTNNMVSWKGKLTTNDIISSNDALSLVNSVYRINALTPVLNNTFNYKIGTHNIILTVFYNNGNTVGITEHGSLSKACPDLEDYYLSIMYKTSNIVDLITNCDNLIQSGIVTKIDSRDGYNYYYLIRQVPLMRYTYLKNSNMVKEVITLTTNFNEKFESIKKIMHNNYSLDIKFYNSYGKSKNYIVGSDSTTYLNRISLSLNFNIKLVDNVDSEIDANIRNEIINFVTDTNTSEVNALYVSDIMNHLRTTFDEIVMIEFRGFNNYGASIQTIKLKDDSLVDLTKQQSVRYVPEFLNVFRKYVKDTTGTTYFIPDINIKYL